MRIQDRVAMFGWGWVFAHVHGGLISKWVESLLDYALTRGYRLILSPPLLPSLWRGKAVCAPHKRDDI